MICAYRSSGLRPSPGPGGGDPPGEPADRGEGVLDLVGDPGRHLPERHELLALHQPVLRGPDGVERALQRLVEGGVLHRERRVGGEHREHLDVLVADRPPLEQVVHVDRPARLPLDHQGNGGEGGRVAAAEPPAGGRIARALRDPAAGLRPHRPFLPHRRRHEAGCVGQRDPQVPDVGPEQVPDLLPRRPGRAVAQQPSWKPADPPRLPAVARPHRHPGAKPVPVLRGKEQDRPAEVQPARGDEGVQHDRKQPLHLDRGHEGAGDVVERRDPLHLDLVLLRQPLRFPEDRRVLDHVRQLGAHRLHQVHPFHVEAQPGGGGVVADRPEGLPLGNDGEAEEGDHPVGGER